MGFRSVVDRHRLAVLATLAGVWTAATVAVLVDAVSATNVAVGLTEESGDTEVPTWLFLATGGGVIGASAILSMLVTDRATIDAFHERAVGLTRPGSLRPVSVALGAVGLGALGFVIVVGLVGPRLGSLSAAVLLTFVGVRAGLTIVAYTIGNPWPALNPWRRIAEVLPNGHCEYPAWLGTWPAVAGVLGFVWLEIVTPLSSSARALAALVIVYTVFTVAGAVVFSPAKWFERADPLSVWFRFYGAVAPIQRTADGISLRPPGSELARNDVLTDLSGVAFAIALVWELTYSGFVVTPAGATVIKALVNVGVPAPLAYLLVLVLGFGICCWVYWLAAGRTRERADTYLSQRYLAIRFAPPLVAIAAGYHFAHYAGFTVSLLPSVQQTLAAPLSPHPNPTVLSLPWWFDHVEVAGILLGHVLAIWVAHTVSFECFTGRLQAIRSQFPFVLVMIVFTMVSLALIASSTVQPPYTPG